MIKVPQNIIPRVSNYSKKSGDFHKTFNLNLSKQYGSITPTKMILNTNSDSQTDLNSVVAFAIYSNNIYALTEDFVYANGSGEMQDSFTKVTTSGAPNGEPQVANSDMVVFNNALYISGGTSILKYNGTWSTPITTQLTNARPHLMTAFGSGASQRLYVTDDYYKVHSVNTSDVISATGTATLTPSLDESWVISFIDSGLDSVWIGYHNWLSGKGLVLEWDGITENVFNRRIDLEAGVMAGCILGNVPYILDRHGRLLAYAGSSFQEVDRLNFKDHISLDGSSSRNNPRFIHPNGMTVTDDGKILLFITNNTNAGTNQDDVLSGVYEYDPQIGLHHKFSPAATGEYGQTRLTENGAIFFNRSAQALFDNNGTVMVGTGYYADASTTKYGIFYNDELESQAYGYFITPRIYTDDIQTTWNEVYAQFDKLTQTGDKIVVKYRTVEKNSVSVTGTWLDSTTFTTTTDITDFVVGDEVFILQGDGAGQSLEITEITSSSATYSVKVRSNPLSATGSFIGRFSNFKIAGTVDTNSNLQWTKFVLSTENTNPWVQFKVELLLTDTEFHAIHVNNKRNI